MKKKLVSIMALSLCLSMGMSTMTACEFDFASIFTPISSSTSQGDSLTDDQILAKVREAYAAWMAYDGALTVNESTERLSSTYESVSTSRMSVDPATNSMYQKETYNDEIEVKKIFKSGETYYSYETESYKEDDDAEPTVEEFYYAHSEAYIAYDIANYTIESLMGISMQGLETYLNVESVAEFNTAMETVMADKIEALPEGTTRTAEAKMECTGNADSCVVELIYANETTSTQEGVTQKQVVNQTASFTEKDGKLAAFAYELSYSQETTTPATEEGGEPVTEKSGYSNKDTLEFAYTFDQTTYDSIAVTAPEGLEIEEEYEKDFNVVINGVENDKVYGYGAPTVKEAMTDAFEDALQDLNYSGEGVDIVWYKDEACTKAIDVETLTAAEYYAIDTVYGKATLKDGYAFVIEDHTMVAADDLPESYKMFFNVYSSSFYAFSTKELRVVKAGEVHIYSDEDETVYLNGTPITAESFTAESGKTYNVEYREIYQKEDIMNNLF